MTKQQTKPPRPQTVVQAEAILRDLASKRDKCLAHGQELAERRKSHAMRMPRRMPTPSVSWPMLPLPLR